MLTGVSVMVAGFATYRAEVANCHTRRVNARLLAIEEARENDRVAESRRGKLDVYKSVLQDRWEIVIKNIGFTNVSDIRVFVNDRPLEDYTFAFDKVKKEVLNQVPKSLSSGQHAAIYLRKIHLPTLERVFLQWKDEDGQERHEQFKFPT